MPEAPSPQRQGGTDPASAAAPAGRVSHGILMLLAASLLFALSDATSKLLTATLPPLEVAFLRSAIMALFTVGAVIWLRGPRVLYSKHPVRQGLRGIAYSAASIIFVLGLGLMPLAEIVAINFVWPLLITVFSVLLLKEKVGIRRFTATIVGFSGMLIIMRPGTGAFQVAALYPLATAVCWSLAVTMTRAMPQSEAPETTMAWSSLIMLAVTVIAVPFVWVSPSATDLAIAFGIGLLAAAGHALIINAYRHAKASTLAPFSYTQLFWAVIAGYFYFGTVPDRWTIAGSLVIVASGLYTIHRERVRRGGD